MQFNKCTRAHTHINARSGKGMIERRREQGREWRDKNGNRGGSGDGNESRNGDGDGIGDGKGNENEEGRGVEGELWYPPPLRKKQSTRSDTTIPYAA